MLAKLAHIGGNALKRHNFKVMAGKVMARFKERGAEDATAWYQSEMEPYEPYLEALDPALWKETQEVCAALTASAKAKLSKIEFDLGGGGNYELLYFLTRYLKAGVVVETGVAAGWSSQAILTALKKNGSGKLFSSDFPYFRMKNPEDYIGFVVDEGLKANWNLFIEGDQYNLPKIAAAATQIDIFHYDSDKSYEGRERALGILGDKFTEKTAVIYDDIQDNAHFRDMVKASGKPYKIFGFGGKYLGLTGPFLDA